MIRVLRGTEAQRVGLGGLQPGRFMLCTDSERLYQGMPSGDREVGSGDTFWDPDALPDTPSAQDDHFDDAALAAKWTEWDLGVPKLTVSEAGHHAILTHTTEGAGRFRGIYQTLPAGDFTVAVKASLISASTADSVAALCLFQDATVAGGDILMIQFFQRSSGLKYRDIFAQRWSDYQTFNANYAGGTIYPSTTNYMRIRRSGTTLYYEYSMDGVGWHRFYTHAQPFAPAHMGFATQNNNAGFDIYGYFDFFRYIGSNQIGPLGKIRGR